MKMSRPSAQPTLSLTPVLPRECDVRPELLGGVHGFFYEADVFGLEKPAEHRRIALMPAPSSNARHRHQRQIRLLANQPQQPIPHRLETERRHPHRPSFAPAKTPILLQPLHRDRGLTR